MAKSLRRPPVKGTPDPDLPGHVLVPVRKQVPGLPKVNFSVPDTSYFRVDKRTNKPTAIVTVMPGGYSVGWDSCGSCSSSIRLCECRSGVSCPNSITHIYVTAGGTKPEPQPLAVTFQAPVSTPAPVKPMKPRKLLRRRQDEVELMADAEAMMTQAITQATKKKSLRRRRSDWRYEGDYGPRYS